jgi:hypothetical protein
MSAVSLLLPSLLVEGENVMSNNTTEGDFGSVFQSHLDGCGSIREMMEHIKFQQMVKRFARRYDFSVFHGDRGPDDLCQDISLKLLEAEMQNKLLIPDNIRTEEDFFIWLFFVIRNFHFGTIRRRLALKRDRLRGDKPSEECDYFLVWDSNYDREEILGLFPEFIKRYQVERQWAIRLWLKDKPYRRIQMVLKRMGFEISHVTVGNWINATIGDFKESLESPPSKQQRTETQRRTGT